jgi:hypothetical protein
MTIKYLTGATLTVLMLAVTACTANITTTTPGTSSGGGGGETAKAAVQVSETAPEVAELNLGDLLPYRLETLEPNQANKTWIIYYYSAKDNKSYRCRTKMGQKVEFVEVTADADRYSPGAEIDETRWQVDSEQAKTVAVQAFQTVNVNVTTMNITNMVLLSAVEFTRRTGTPSDDPVWVCTVNPGTAASPSPSATPTASPTATPTASPTAMPTESPSATPTASPTTGTTIVNNITNVYINAKNGNQISVNTGTQTNAGNNTNTTTTGNGTSTTTL